MVPNQVTAENQDYFYDYLLNVRYGEVGHDGVVTLTSLANWLQEAAGLNALKLGFGEDIMTSMGLGWILTRLVLRIRRLPASGEAIRVRTWPSGLDRFAHRGYEVYDADDQLIVSSGSAWSLMDVASRRLAAIPPELAEAFPDESLGCDAFTCRVLPRLAPKDEEPAQASLRVRRDDLDLNQHVNNAHYLSWLLEPLPFVSGQAKIPSLVDLSFRAECFPGEKLVSAYAQAGPEVGDMPVIFDTPAPCRLIHAIRRAEGSQDDVCRAVTLWTQNPLA